jgi:hypothetical protein
MMSVLSMYKTSGRYHGIFLSTELGSDGTPLAHDTAVPLIGHILSGWPVVATKCTDHTLLGKRLLIMIYEVLQVSKY